MPCWSIHQPMSAKEDHRAITGRPGMVDFWRPSGMPWCLGVCGRGEFSQALSFPFFLTFGCCQRSSIKNVKQSNFWVGSLDCWWSISAIRCFRIRESESSPLFTFRGCGPPSFWRWGLRWFGHVPEICFGVLVEIPWETSWEPSGAQGQFLDSDFMILRRTWLCDELADWCQCLYVLVMLKFFWDFFFFDPLLDLDRCN